MTSIPANLSRVPNLLSSQVTRNTLTTTNAALLRLQAQIASNRRIGRPSDDPVAASLVNVLNQRLANSEQRGRNMEHATSVMGTLDQSLAALSESAQEAKSIASSQVGVGSDAQTRSSQSVVVGSLIDSVVATLNRDYAGIHYFGGSRTGSRPIEAFHGGFRYTGDGDGLYTDLGPGIDFPITIGADSAIGALSARVRGNVDLNPTANAATRIEDLRGPGGAGATMGSLTVTIDDGGPPPLDVQVDLSQARTLGDVATALESAIRTADPAALGGAFGSAIGFSGERLSVGSIAAGYTITFADGAAGSTALNLGLDGFGYTTATPVSTATGKDLDPAVTDRTTLGSLSPASPLVYGDFVVRNGGRSGTATTAANMTIGELKQAVARLDLGARVEIDPSGRSINIVNEVSGFRMSVEEAGGLVATSLGVRTLAGTTPPTDFNFGRGVVIADGNLNPSTGLPDPNRNTDFRVTLTNGSSFTVDLVAADMASVNTVIARINAEAAGAGYGGVFTAALAASGNGIEFQDTAGGAGSLGVTSLNGYAAEDLGLLDGSYTPGATAVLRSSDRSTVRVDSLLSTLVDLRRSLLDNDSIGITFAGEGIESAVEQVVQARALVGARSSRVEDAKAQREDAALLDESIRSGLQDLDLVEASSKFALLQTQLQAGLQAAAAIRPLSLLSFL